MHPYRDASRNNRHCRRLVAGAATLLVLVGCAMTLSQAAGAQADSMFAVPIQRAAAFFATGDFTSAFIDLDGDGIGDFVLAVDPPTSVAVRYGDPDGTYEAPVQAPVGPLGTQFGDVTGDGLTDIVGLKQAGTIRVTPILGKGSFGAVIDTTGVGGIADAKLLLGDVIEDGLSDAAVLGAKQAGQSCDNCLRLYAAVGDGSFTFVSTQTIGFYSDVLQFLDVDGDGHLDLLGTQAAPFSFVGLGVRLGHGDGTFSAPAVTTLDKHVGTPSFADIDGDGLLDMAIGQGPAQIESHLGLYRNKGDGTFQKKLDELLDDPTGYGELVNPALGDITEDGLVDVTMYGYAIDGQALFPANLIVQPGISPFALGPPIVTLASGYIGPMSLHDIDRDGHLDVVTDGSFTAAWLGTGTGSFVAPAAIDAGLPTGELATPDLDGDGNADILATTVKPGGLSIVHGNGQGGFGPSELLTEFDAADQLAIGDIDADGDTDAVLSGSVGSLDILAVARTTGGTLQFSSPLVVGSVADIAMADLDGDGAPDLVLGRSDAAEIDIMHGDGAGGFAAGGTLMTPSTGKGIAVGDVNMDGYLDVLATLPDDDAIAIFSSASGVPDLLSAPAVQQVLQADFDGDGDPDAVSTAEASGADSSKLRIFTNSGNGTLALSQELVAGDSLRALSAADLNYDGLLDVICTAKFPPDVKGLVLVCLGKPSGLFSEPYRFATGDLPFGVASADFDHDGYADLVTASWQQSSLGLLLNRSATWATLGNSLGTPSGTPLLQGTGEPVAGQSITLTTSGAPAQAHGWLVVGLHATYAAYKGGVLVPSADLVLPYAPNSTVSATWPAGVALGTPIYLQAWFIGNRCAKHTLAA